MNLIRTHAAARVVAAIGVLAVVTVVSGQTRPMCDPDNGGIKLPPGFCALVVADNLGPARHMVVAPNGDLYVALQTSGGRGRGQRPAAARSPCAIPTATVASRSRNRSAAAARPASRLRNGYVYLAHPLTVERMKMTAGQLKPTGAAETIVTGLPSERQHEDKGLAFDGNGSLYINVGAPSNACQDPDRRPGVKGVDPCPILEKHGGIWKFDENKTGQTQEQRHALRDRHAADAGDHLA